uniref:H15 domain-containing protein n=1 Tax=Picea sitchensis TaxID=3332 RepID=A9P2F7_PICSI|nr:unknown [Picea sitchensis]
MASMATEKDNAPDVIVPPAIDAQPQDCPKEKKLNRRTAPVHPPYFEMIKEAILALKERGGSSPRAIAKYMEERYKSHLPPNYKKILAVQIKKLVLAGKLIKVKASFKLAAAENKGKKEEDSAKKMTGLKKNAKISSEPMVTLTSAKSAKPKVAGKTAKSAAAKPSAAKPAKVSKLADADKISAGMKTGALAKKPGVVAAKAKKQKSIKSSAA